MREVDPIAYLVRRRNTRRGVASRTKIIRVMRMGAKSVAELSRSSDLSESVIRYHLENLRVEGVVERMGKKRGGKWRLTGVGQRTIEEATES